jgi:membrane-associated phospholipid phosphatase
VVFAGALAGDVSWRGVPASRDSLVLWIVFGLLAFSLSDVRGWARGIVFDWCPLVFILFAYDLLRGSAGGLFGVHYMPQIEADRALVGTVPTAWLQAHLWNGPARLHWYDYLAWFVYLTHFFATLFLAAVLWLRARRWFRRYVAVVSTLAMLGFATYVVFPAAPPWLASEQGVGGHVQRLVGPIWGHVPYVSWQALFEGGARFSNQVAAVPSLHAGYALLISLFLCRFVSWPGRFALAAYPLLMGFSLIYLGEHYLFDVLLGWAYALLAFGIVELAVRWRVQRETGRARMSVLRPAPESG